MLDKHGIVISPKKDFLLTLRDNAALPRGAVLAPSIVSCKSPGTATGSGLTMTLLILKGLSGGAE